MTYHIYNFISGKDEPQPDHPDHSSPTEAWLAGWYALMVDGYKANPYPECTQDYRDYEEGWEAAERD